MVTCRRHAAAVQASGSVWDDIHSRAQAADSMCVFRLVLGGCCPAQVLQYYYRGVASWDWFYPYHYAPMAQDMRRLDGIDGE